MLKTELLTKLRDLHEELSSINEDLVESNAGIDSETIDALGQLVTDANELFDVAMESNIPGGENLTERHDFLMERIKKFESKHPRITQFLSEVTDVLGMMGI